MKEWQRAREYKFVDVCRIDSPRGQSKERRMTCKYRSVSGLFAVVLLTSCFANSVVAQSSGRQKSSGAPVPLSAAIDARTWNRVDSSTDRALAWLASGQRRTGNGSFVAPTSGQPGVTSLGAMAFMSKGHVPGGGKYGTELEAAVDYVISCQRSDGLISGGPGGRNFDGKTALYNHAIAGLMLSQAYGMVDRERADRIAEVVPRALAFTRKRQSLPRPSHEKGGWRYFYQGNPESDLSVTGWQMMFLRSAKNAGFDVPQQHIDEALKYVHSCWDDNEGVFYYMRRTGNVRWSRGMCGVGVVALAMGGEHKTAISRRAGRVILNNGFHRYGDRVGSGGERWFYSAYVCSQAMSQLGGDYWETFYPTLVQTILATQRPDGSWPAEPHSGDSKYGNACTTTFSVLAMTPPLQLLPLYQR